MDIRSKHLSSEDRGVILAEHNRGSSQRLIGQLLLSPASELRPCYRTLGYFTPVRERGTKWDNIDAIIQTIIRQLQLNGNMSLVRRKAALPRSLGSLGRS